MSAMEGNGASPAAVGARDGRTCVEAP